MNLNQRLTFKEINENLIQYKSVIDYVKCINQNHTRYKLLMDNTNKNKNNIKNKILNFNSLAIIQNTIIIRISNELGTNYVINVLVDKSNAIVLTYKYDIHFKKIYEKIYNIQISSYNLIDIFNKYIN